MPLWSKRSCWSVNNRSPPRCGLICIKTRICRTSSTIGGQICQLVLNLLLNAVQAIDGAGAIRVELSLFEGNATIAVVDTGPGIAPEHLPNIFRPFYAIKGSGTGLGLSLARRTAEEHHGRIGVTSAIGKGATFAVVLPLLQTKARGAAS